MAVVYDWTVSGASLGFDSDTLEDVYFAHGDTVSCTATPTDGTDDGTTRTSNTVTIENSEPSVTAVSVSPARPTVSSTLTCSYAGYDDADGDVDQSGYDWTIGGATVGTASTLSGAFASGDIVTCTVTPDDGTDTGSALSASVTVDNTPPVLASVTLTPDPAQEGDTLTCTAGTTTDIDGTTTFSYTYAWTVNGSRAAPTTRTLTGTYFDAGDDVACVVTPSDGTAAGAAVTSNTLTIENTAPVVTTVSIAPASGGVGDSLTCSASSTDADGGSPTLSYAWSTGATGASVTLTSAEDPGDTVTCTATASDTDTDTDSASVTIGNTAPVVSSVTLSPSAVATNDTLTATVVSSDADGDALTLTYDWYVDGVLARSGASASLSGASYFDRDEEVYVEVTADDGADTDSLTSSSVTVDNTAPTAPGVEVFGEVYAELGATTSYADLTQAYLYADIVLAERSGTLATFGVYQSGSTCTSIDYFVLSSSSGSTGAWTLEWSSTGNSISSSAAYQSAGDVDVVVSEGTYYAFGWATTCTSGVRFYYGLTGLPTDAGFGTAIGYVGQTYTGSGALSGTMTVNTGYTAPEAMDVTFYPDEVHAGDDLTCSVTTESTDDDGDAISYTFGWDVDGVAYTSATDAAMESVVDGTDVAAEEVWTCEVEVSDGAERATASATVTAEYSCDINVNGSSMYHFCMTFGLSWNDAELYCEDRGETLAVINTSAEWSFINSTLNSDYVYHGSTIPWIGYSDQASEGSWVWVTGEAGYDDWQAGEPQGGRGENCADFNQGGSQGYRDALCSGETAFICEG